MIAEKVYRGYLSSLLAGEHRWCYKITADLVDRGAEIEELYVALFQRSLYEVGDMWERRQISVAVEHMASAITESLMALVYPAIFTVESSEKSAVISCVANEYHQIGGKMVAAVFQRHGWHAYFLGTNTSLGDMLELIEEKRPQLVALSLSISYNLPNMARMIKAVADRWPGMPILVGGQAFQHSGLDILAEFASVRYVSSLDELENLLTKGTFAGAAT